MDGKYARQTPPTVRRPDYPADGLVYELLFAMTTGFDDMRGGADHVDVTLRMSDNTTRYFSNISEGGRWVACHFAAGGQCAASHAAEPASLNVEPTSGSTTQ